MTTTLPLRELLRAPSTVKRLTRSGHTVRITDRGKPLWDVSPAEQRSTEADETARIAAIDEILDEVLADTPLPPAPGSLSCVEIIRQGRDRL